MKIKHLLFSFLLCTGLAWGQGQFNGGGGGTGGVGGSGTGGTLPIWATSTTQQNSSESESAGVFDVGTTNGMAMTHTGSSVWQGIISSGTTIADPSPLNFGLFLGIDGAYRCQLSSFFGGGNCFVLSAMGGQIDLTSQVANILPQASGGTGQTAVVGFYETGVLVPGELVDTETKALSTGAATLTFSASFTFTSSSTFGCTCTDQTAANACKAVPASATTVTLAGTGSDTLWVSCSGH